VELSDVASAEVTEKEISDVTEESSTPSDVQGDRKVPGKRSISHFVSEVMTDFHGCECEISISSRLRTPVYLSFVKKIKL
jgi:hypothetical protein